MNIEREERQEETLRGIGCGLFLELLHEIEQLRRGQPRIARPSFDAFGRANTHKAAAAVHDFDALAEIERSDDRRIGRQLAPDLHGGAGYERFLGPLLGRLWFALRQQHSAQHDQ
jgi:hypothetical protein